VHSGFKVGPNYTPPAASVAERWIDTADARVRRESADLCRWWTVFSDPVLDGLICDAYRQNLTLKQAGCRVLEARAQLAFARGNIFPQTQDATGSYDRIGTAASGPVPGTHFDSWNSGFNLSWEIDFWGRLRRAITAADDQVQFSVEDYDATLVTLLGDVASNYVTARQAQERIDLTKKNVELQRGILNITKARLEVGRVGELDVDQAETTMEQTAAQIPALEINLRQAENQLCILLGMPPADLRARLGVRAIPTAPPEVAVGMPADLLTRRPDVRRAERAAAAQAEQIGIAQALFYAIMQINGNMGCSARNFADLFKSSAFNGSVGPSFQWNILNYGRILANVKLQDQKFREQVLAYQQQVLQAADETENGVVTFLQAQQQTKDAHAAVIAAQKAMDIVIAQYKVGTVDFNRVATIEQTLVQVQDLEAQSRGLIATGLIQVYRALGGGWQIRLQQGEGSGLVQPPQVPGAAEHLPAPTPVPIPAPMGEHGPLPPVNLPKAPVPDKDGHYQPKPLPESLDRGYAMVNPGLSK
jgi:NodT family efflux transporter outer membrane factor (OMF) lipoprotein